MTKKITISIILLLVATGFWLWSRDLVKQSVSERQDSMEAVSAGKPISDAEMDSEIDAALMLDSELELKGVDGEF